MQTMKIRFMRYDETTYEHGKPLPDAPRFCLRVEDARTGDGQEAALRGLCPKGTTSIGVRAGNTATTDFLTLEEARSEAARLRELGHEVSGDRAARKCGVVS